jgi:hypothetical protein
MSETTAAVTVRLPAFIRVLVVQPIKSGTSKNGKPYQLQEVDCIALDEQGEALQVGVLPLPNSLLGTITEGTYSPVYGMRVDFQTRKIAPSIVGLNRVENRQRVASPSKSA